MRREVRDGFADIESHIADLFSQTHRPELQNPRGVRRVRSSLSESHVYFTLLYTGQR